MLKIYQVKKAIVNHAEDLTGNEEQQTELERLKRLKQFCCSVTLLLCWLIEVVFIRWIQCHSNTANNWFLFSFRLQNLFSSRKKDLSQLVNLLNFPQDEYVQFDNGCRMRSEEVFLRGLYELVSGVNKHRIASSNRAWQGVLRFGRMNTQMSEIQAGRAAQYTSPLGPVYTFIKAILPSILKVYLKNVLLPRSNW